MLTLFYLFLVLVLHHVWQVIGFTRQEVALYIAVLGCLSVLAQVSRTSVNQEFEKMYSTGYIQWWALCCLSMAESWYFLWQLCSSAIFQFYLLDHFCQVEPEIRVYVKLCAPPTSSKGVDLEPHQSLPFNQKSPWRTNEIIFPEITGRLCRSTLPLVLFYGLKIRVTAKS